MRGVAFALLASGVLALGTLGPAPASATCYGDCEYLDAVSTGSDYSSDYSSTGDDYSYEPSSSYASYYDGGYRRPHYGSYRWGYSHQPYYRSHHWGYHHRPHYRGYYGHRYGGYYRHHHHHHHHYGYRERPVVLLGGGWSQTAWRPGIWGGGCQVAYIPYGWRWFRGTTC